MKEGQKVTIHNQHLDGRSFIEGEAILVKRLIKDHDANREYWLVRFNDTEGVFRRWVELID